LDQGRIDANKKRISAARKVAKKEEKGKDSKANDGHPPGGKFPVKPVKVQPKNVRWKEKKTIIISSRIVCS
jgi:hypothetical protein